MQQADRGASTGGGGVPSFLTDLIEYWPLADLVGEHAGRVLTNNGSVTFGAGHIDQCAAFSGSNYLDMAAPASLQTGDIDIRWPRGLSSTASFANPQSFHKVSIVGTLV